MYNWEFIFGRLLQYCNSVSSLSPHFIRLHDRCGSLYLALGENDSCNLELHISFLGLKSNTSSTTCFSAAGKGLGIHSEIVSHKLITLSPKRVDFY